MILIPVVIPKEKKGDFYQSKYDHFKNLTLWVVTVSCIVEMTFFVSDCSAVLGFSKDTFLPRFAVLIPLILYLIAFRYVSSYKVMTPFSYIMVHACMLSVIWVGHNIRNITNLRESFLLMTLMLLVVGISAPRRMHVFFHVLMIGEFVLAYFYAGLTGIDTFISLDGAALVSVCAFEYIFENAYAEQYNTQKKLEDISLHDQLTGAFNRTKLKMLCMEDTEELVFKNAGFILLDINDFKKINENFGHDTGDRIIKELYKGITICTRLDDVCIRMGGEQFLILVPNQGLARTKEIGERIRGYVAKATDFPCTFKVSVGVAIYKGGDYHVTINLADKALRFAKENDVDMVVAYEDM